MALLPFPVMEIRCDNDRDHVNAPGLGYTPVITVTAAIVVKDNRILAARRRAGMRLEGLWEFPGGKLEAGETPQQCLARELAEEFGIETSIGRCVGESVHDDGVLTVRLLAYQVTHVSGDFSLTDHDKMKWLTRDTLYTVQWAPADIPLVAQAMSLL